MVRRVDRSQLVDEHPRLYHMAEDGTWPSIQRHGLLSTLAIVDLYQPDPGQRAAILSQVRRRGITLESDALGAMRIRDQLPLKFLEQCLTDGTSPQQYLDALNGRVFFWLTRQRLQRLLGAAQYRRARHTVLTVDTAELIDKYDGTAELAPYNTGSMHVPNAPARGLDVFRRIADYPHAAWRAKRGPSADAVVELTIPYSVPDIADFVLVAQTWEGGIPTETLFQRGV
jgi:uncharacterized protein DUF7002